MVANTTDLVSKHFCPHCHKEVPKIELKILGTLRLIQPMCKCEVDKEMAEVDRLVNAADRREIERKYALDTLGERFRNSTFKNFIPRKGTENILKIAKDYAYNFELKKGDGLLLWGDPGNGKSHLVGAIANHLSKEGYIVIVINLPEFFQRLRATFRNKSNESENEVIKPLINCDLLILDEIGHKKVTAFEADVLYRIIDGRYMRNKRDLYTSNSNPDQLLEQLQPKIDETVDEFTAEKLGKKIFRRIIETSLPVENKATSYSEEIALKRIRKFHGLDDSK